MPPGKGQDPQQAVLAPRQAQPAPGQRSRSPSQRSPPATLPALIAHAHTNDKGPGEHPQGGLVVALLASLWHQRHALAVARAPLMQSHGGCEKLPRGSPAWGQIPALPSLLGSFWPAPSHLCSSVFPSVKPGQGHQRRSDQSPAAEGSFVVTPRRSVLSRGNFYPQAWAGIQALPGASLKLSNMNDLVAGSGV